MEKIIKYYTENYFYNPKEKETSLVIKYKFPKDLSKEIKKGIRARLKNFDGILNFLEKSENVEKKGNKQLFYVRKPSFLKIYNLKLELSIKVQKKVKKSELFDANKLEKYLLFGI
ncbi:MAG: hypothetical protein WC812_02440 [Candidatus Pacearchaeota archaeon]